MEREMKDITTPTTRLPVAEIRAVEAADLPGLAEMIAALAAQHGDSAREGGDAEPVRRRRGRESRDGEGAKRWHGPQDAATRFNVASPKTQVSQGL